MSLEIVEKIIASEDLGKQRIEQAKVDARNIVESASVKGEALVKAVEGKALATGKSMIEKAEANAAARSEKILAEAEAQGKLLKDAAGECFDEAVKLIVERIKG